MGSVIKVRALSAPWFTGAPTGPDLIFRKQLEGTLAELKKEACEAAAFKERAVPVPVPGSRKTSPKVPPLERIS